MARRIDIELTSARDDGTWTWRAAGAKQPKGVLEGSLLYPTAKVGDVVRAEAEFEIEGITVIAVLAPRAERAGPERIELLALQQDEPGVRLISAGPGRGPRRPRREGDDERRGPRPPREGTGRREAPERGDRRDRPERGDRGARPDQERRARSDRAPRAERPAPTPPAPPKPKPKRLQPGRAHRDAVLGELPAEHRAIAEQVLRGGIPAVRKAVEEANVKAVAEGRSAVKDDALVALAEELVPRLRFADWLDRAEAAVLDLDTVAIRDLRSVVTAAETAVRDDTGRALAAQLRDALERRLAAQRDEWVAEITRSLDDGRVVRALRISGRPPEPGSRFPQELATRLAEHTGAAMSADTTSDRWAALLDAAVASPVRRMVKPAGLPAEPGDDLLTAAKKAAARMPAVGALLGIEAPPRPPRPTGPRPAIGARRPAPGATTTEQPPAPPAAPSEPAPPTAPAAPAAPGAFAAPIAPAAPGDGATVADVPVPDQPNGDTAAQHPPTAPADEGDPAGQPATAG